MKLFGDVDTEALRHHFGKKIMELEEEKRIVQVKFYILVFSASSMLKCF